MHRLCNGSVNPKGMMQGLIIRLASFINIIYLVQLGNQAWIVTDDSRPNAKRLQTSMGRDTPREFEY